MAGTPLAGSAGSAPMRWPGAGPAALTHWTWRGSGSGSCPNAQSAAGKQEAPVCGPRCGSAARRDRPGPARRGRLMADRRLLAVRPVRNRRLSACGRQPGRRPRAPGVPEPSPAPRPPRAITPLRDAGDASCDGEAADHNESSLLLLSSGCLGFVPRWGFRGEFGVHEGLPRGRVWPSPRRASRSFVLASLRALHLDLRLRRRQCGSDRGMPSPALAAGCGRRVVAGPGSGLSEVPVCGV